MTHLTRTAAWCAALISLGLFCGSARGQNGTNFHVLSNGLDAIFLGIGAGGNQQAGVDGLGYWVCGEDLRGNTLVPGVIAPPGPESFFGYKQVGTRWTMCVLGRPQPNLALDFPAMVITEFTGRNPHQPDVFLKPGCVPSVGMCSPNFIPYGGPNGTSVSFLLTMLPSGTTGSATGIASSQVILIPNNGLVPSARNGVGTIIAAASANLPINSTGFCWTVQFTWLNSALAQTALTGTQDYPDGWWTWLTTSRFGNQYWGMSDDELNVFQSQSVGLDGGATSLLLFPANVDFVTHHLTEDPATNDALQPAGWNCTGTYYSTSSTGAGGGFPVPNGGFDMGRHLGISVSGSGGVKNPITCQGNQSPFVPGCPVLFAPTVGFVTWSNEDSNGNGLCDEIYDRLTWVQFDWDATFGVDPSMGTSVPAFFGLVRFPVDIPFTVPAPWPQPITQTFFPFYTHVASDKSGNSQWPDPDGFPGGTFGVCPIVGGSLHLSLVGFGPLCIGSPIAWSYGSSGSGPLLNPETAPPSTGRQILLLD